MAIGEISLTSSARANLLSLQGTAKLLGATQDRLASGKKVNSALDNASSYFASKGFINSANDLSGLKDSMATALQTVKAASDAITSLTNVVNQLKGIVNSALQTTDTATRAGLASQYNGLLTQLDELANDASFNGTNLVNSVTSSLRVVFNASNTTSLTLQGSNLTSVGMGTAAAVGGFAVGALASTVTADLTVGADTTLTNQVYSGTLSNLSVTGAAATGGLNAVITSNSSDYSNGATAASLTGTAVADYAAVVLALNNAGLSESTVTGASTTTAATSIKGQFTATGTGAASTYTLGTNTLTSAVAGANVTYSLGAGQSIQITHDDGGGIGTTGSVTTYTNTTAAAITFNLGTGSSVTVGAGGTVNSTASYKLTGGTVGVTGVTIGSGTLAGNTIVDALGQVEGGSVTTVTTSSVAGGTAQGTTTQAAVSAYDVSGATVTAIANTSVTGTRDGTSAVTYAATGATITATGVTTLSGASTTVVTDAINTAQNQLNAALASLRTAGQSLGNNNTIIQTRQDFTTNLINTLQTASDNLVLADTNEEGANLQSLQARNQLGIVSLGISGQLAQSVLKLF